MIWLVWLGLATMFPYEFTTAGLLARISDVLRDDRAATASELAHNLALFVPLGVLVSRRVGASRTAARSVVLACAAGLLLSVCVESLQVLLPRRHPTLFDVGANSAGSALGALADRRWGGLVDRWLERWRAHLSGAPAVALLAVYAVGWAFAGAAIQRQSRLSNWDPTFPLEVGNERTGDRPWRGRIFLLDVSSSATPPNDVSSFADGRMIPLEGTVITRIDFIGDAPYLDIAGGTPPLNWVGVSGHTPPAGARLSGRPWLDSAAPAETLVRRIVEANAFSIRLVCASDDLEQQGPARIVSNSVDQNYRNLTIAQQHRDLVVRIRTPHTGRNGSRPEVVIPGVFSDFEPRDILITYDGANVLAAVARSGRVHSVAFSPGPMIASRQVSIDIEADDHRPLEWAFSAVLFVPPAILVSAVIDARGRRMVLGVAWVLAFALLFEVALVQASGRAFSWEAVAVPALIGALAVAAFAATPPRQGANPEAT